MHAKKSLQFWALVFVPQNLDCLIHDLFYRSIGLYLLQLNYTPTRANEEEKNKTKQQQTYINAKSLVSRTNIYTYKSLLNGNQNRY